MCDAAPELSRFVDPAALFDALHGGAATTDARNAVLAALVRTAQTGHEAAVSVLLLALWPGLDGVHRRLAGHFRGDPETLVAELAGRTVYGIHALDLARVSRVAATLIMNTERDILRELKRRGRERPYPQDSADERPLRPPSCFGLPPGLDADVETARLVGLLEPMIGDDALLVIAIAVVGERQDVAAEALGLRPDAGRKRYQRAIQKLRRCIADAA